MSGGKNGVRTPEWVPNPRYRPPEPPHASRIAEILEGADRVVAVSTPLLGDADVERAVESYGWGDRPRHYILTSAPGPHGRGDDLAKEARRHGESLKALGGEALIRVPNRFRSSIVLSGSDKRGLFYTGDMRAGGPRRSHELLVKLTRPEASDLLSIFRWVFWEGATHEYAGGGPTDCRPLGKVEFPGVKSVRLLGPRHTSLGDEAMKMLDGCPRDVVSAGFGWGSDPKIAGRLREISRRGTRVSMVVGLTESARGAAEAAQDGIRVAGISKSCARALVADSRALVTTLAGGRSSGDAFEIGLVIDGRRAADVKRTLNEWVKNFQYGIG